MLTPRIEKAVTEVKGVTLAKVGPPQMILIFRFLPLINISSLHLQVDIDEHNDLAFDFDVSSVPVLVGILNGKEVARMVGLQDPDKLKKFVEMVAASK